MSVTAGPTTVMKRPVPGTVPHRPAVRSQLLATLPRAPGMRPRCYGIRRCGTGFGRPASVIMRPGKAVLWTLPAMLRLRPTAMSVSWPGGGGRQRWPGKRRRTSAGSSPRSGTTSGSFWTRSGRTAGQRPPTAAPHPGTGTPQPETGTPHPGIGRPPSLIVSRPRWNGPRNLALVRKPEDRKRRGRKALGGPILRSGDAAGGRLSCPPRRAREHPEVSGRDVA
jgi:hypothetical protein